jgi:hypothetical protein
MLVGSAHLLAAESQPIALQPDDLLDIVSATIESVRQQQADRAARS